LAKDCPRDPNIKTRENAQKEMKRIMHIKHPKKLFTETQVTTAHLLKQCTHVPKIKFNENLKLNK